MEYRIKLNHNNVHILNLGDTILIKGYESEIVTVKGIDIGNRITTIRSAAVRGSDIINLTFYIYDSDSTGWFLPDDNTQGYVQTKYYLITRSAALGVLYGCD